MATGKESETLKALRASKRAVRVERVQGTRVILLEVAALAARRDVATTTDRAPQRDPSCAPVAPSLRRI
jgi:hypothetical protein